MDFSSFNIDGFTTTQGLLLLLLIIFSWILLRSVLPPRGKNGKPIPGPIGVPILGYLPFLGMEPYKKLFEMREKYGDIIGLYLGPKYTVVLNEYSVMKEVLSHSAALDRAPKLFDILPKIGFLTANGEKWVEQRKFCVHTNRQLGLGRGVWEDILAEETAEFIEKLEATKGKAVDVSHDLYASLTSSIISLMIGRRLKDSKDANKIQMSAEFSDLILKYLGPSFATTVIPGLRKFCEVFGIAGYDRMAQLVQEFSLFLREEIDRHKTNLAAQDQKDFMNFYLKKLNELKSSGDKKHYFSEAMLEGNITTLFIGSTDTEFSSLTWLLRLMAAHKDVQEKVYDELMEAVGEGGRARYEDKEKIPYTFATVMEGQRISSIVPFSINRKTIEDIHIQGMTIPKGSEVTANLWALHHDPKYWEQPEMFRPERFLEENGKILVNNPPSYVPFSVGKRNCPGISIAYMEVLAYFSEVVKNFEISAPPGMEPEFKTVKGIATCLCPQPLCFKRRKHNI